MRSRSRRRPPRVAQAAMWAARWRRLKPSGQRHPGRPCRKTVRRPQPRIRPRISPLQAGTRTHQVDGRPNRCARERTGRHYLDRSWRSLNPQQVLGSNSRGRTSSDQRFVGCGSRTPDCRPRVLAGGVRRRGGLVAAAPPRRQCRSPPPEPRRCPVPAPHPPALCRRAVELARLREQPIAQVVKDLSIPKPCLRNWKPGLLVHVEIRVGRGPRSRMEPMQTLDVVGDRVLGCERQVAGEGNRRDPSIRFVRLAPSS